MSAAQINVFLPAPVQSKIRSVVDSYGQEPLSQEKLDFYISMIAAQSFVLGFVADRSDGLKAVSAFREAENQLAGSVSANVSQAVEQSAGQTASPSPRGISPEELRAARLARQNQAIAEAMAEAKAFNPRSMEGLLSLGLNADKVYQLYERMDSQRIWPSTAGELQQLVDAWLTPSLLTELYIAHARTEGEGLYRSKLVSALTYNFDLIHAVRKNEVQEISESIPAETQEPFEPSQAEAQTETQVEVELIQTPAPVSEPSPIPAEPVQAAEAPSVEQTPVNSAADSMVEEQLSLDDEEALESEIDFLRQKHGPDIYGAVKNLGNSTDLREISVERLAKAVRGMLEAIKPEVMEDVRARELGVDAFFYLVESSQKRAIASERMSSTPKRATASDEKRAPRRTGRPPRQAKAK